MNIQLFLYIGKIPDVWIMRELCVRVPEWMLELIDALIRKGIFITRSEFVRYAIRLALSKYEKELEDVFKHFRSVRRLEFSTKKKPDK